MAHNRIDEIMEQRGIKTADFARDNGITASTLYNIRKRATLKDVAVSSFIAIADGLGMTVEELYTGEPARRVYTDERQRVLNERYELLNDDGKDKVATYADDLSSVPAYMAIHQNTSPAEAMGA